MIVPFLNHPHGGYNREEETSCDLGVIVLTLIALAALAASPNPYSFSQNKRNVTANQAPSFATSSNHDTTLKTIAGNLSTYQYGVYFCCFGNTIAAGPPNFPFQTWVAIPFTPTADASVTRVEASVGTFGGSDAGAFRMQLLADNNDSPGNPIKTFPVATEPTYGTCCTLDVGNHKAGIPVKKGTQYWLAVTTSSTQTSFAGGWAFNSTDRDRTRSPAGARAQARTAATIAECGRSVRAVIRCQATPYLETSFQRLYP